MQLTPARRSLAGLVLLAVMLATVTSPAEAGAWPQKKREGLLLTGFSWHWLNAPGGSSVTKTEYSFYGEYGLTDRITLIGRMAFQSLEETRPSGEDEALANALFAIGGTEAAVRMRLASHERWMLSGQVLTTFRSGGENRINARFGTGGGDVEFRALLGRSIGEDGFADIQIARRDRAGRSGEEWRIDVTAGTAVTDRWRVMAQTFSLYAEARPDAAGYDGHRAQLSVIYDMPSGFSVSLAALGTLSARNLAEERAALLSIWRRF